MGLGGWRGPPRRRPRRRWRLATGVSSSPPQGRAWQRFSVGWTPKERGTVVLASRAQTKDGLCQPISGRRNAIHGVPLNVI